jgi:5-methylcytosine-specific restriction protein A
MGKITTKMTQVAYEFSKNVYQGLVERDKALNELENTYGMNRGSASDYIQGFRSMMAGEGYKRTFNTEATDYFLDNIRNDFGFIALKTALDSVEKHIEYYTNLDKGNLNSVRKVFEKHNNAFNNSQVNGDELDPSKKYLEGQKKTIIVNAYERNNEARKECISHYGLNCQVCMVNFGELYGELGEGFIHVHHLKLISTIGELYKIDPINDLKPVCPNCHAMLHRKNPPLTIIELKEIMIKHMK